MKANEKVLYTVGEERNLLKEMRKRQSMRLDHVLLGERLLKAVTEQRTLVTKEWISVCEKPKGFTLCFLNPALTGRKR
jgi:hypothetical protein